MSDNVNHPAHYTMGRFEVIDVLEDWGLNYHLANAVKYIARCEHKGNKVEDLQKAVWYLQREIAREVKNEERRDGVKHYPAAVYTDDGPEYHTD